MKRLYLIGGTMGIGKTTVSRVLQERLTRCALLDGDWCWAMHPFLVTEATKAMVMDNICCLLNNFLHCPDVERVVFCWVMHEQAILDELLSRVDVAGCQVVNVSLVCRPETLRTRLTADVSAGLRAPEIIKRSLPRLPLYDKLNTQRIDVSDLTPEQTADVLCRLGNEG